MTTKEEFKKGFAERLYRAMGTCEFTTYTLADEIDVAQATVFYWASAQPGRLPNAYNLAKLCEVLHVSADWLLFGKDVRYVG